MEYKLSRLHTKGSLPSNKTLETSRLSGESINPTTSRSTVLVVFMINSVIIWDQLISVAI